MLVELAKSVVSQDVLVRDLLLASAFFLVGRWTKK
jgi:hypothetical protein